MNSSALSNKDCEDHKQKIEYVCLNPICKNNLACFQCIKQEIHSGHQKFLEKYYDLEEILNQQRSICSNLLSQLDDIINHIFYEYYRLRQGIENKYLVTIERINQINSNQFNQFISNITQIEQYQKQILKQMEDDCKDYTNKLKTQVKDLELGQVNYLEIKKKDQEEKLYNEGNSNILLFGYTMYYDKKNFEEAIKLFDQVLNQNPQHILSLCYKGASLSKLGQYQKSIGCYDKVLDIDPSNVLSLIEKGKFLNRLKNIQEPIQRNHQPPAKLPGKKNNESELLYEIELNITDKDNLNINCDSTVTVNYITEFLLSYLPELIENVRSRIIVKSKNLNRELNPNETVGQILQNQAKDKFDIEFQQQIKKLQNENQNQQSQQNDPQLKEQLQQNDPQLQNQAQNIEQQEFIRIKTVYKNQTLICEVDPTCQLIEFYSSAVSYLQINENVQMVFNNQNLLNLPGSTSLKNSNINNDSIIYFEQSKS